VVGVLQAQGRADCLIPLWLRAAFVLGVLTVFIALLGRIHAKGYEAGAAAVRVKWTAERLDLETRHSEALYAAQAAFRRDLALRESMERALAARLANSDARGADLARRLRYPRACPMPAADSPSGGSDGSPGESSDPEAIGIALGAHLAACERDAERLKGWQDWMTGVESNHR
jgi:hypothetical protein